METATGTKRQDASDILIAILVNLKRISGKKQLFLKAYSYTFQSIFVDLCSLSDEKFIRKYFVFSNRGPVPFCPSLQEAIELLQFAGLLCWPDIQEPNLMRLNPSAEDWYEKVLTVNGEKRLPLLDIGGAQLVAEEIKKNWPELIVDRPYLINC